MRQCSFSSQRLQYLRLLSFSRSLEVEEVVDAVVDAHLLHHHVEVAAEVAVEVTHRPHKHTLKRRLVVLDMLLLLVAEPGASRLRRPHMADTVAVTHRDPLDRHPDRRTRLPLRSLLRLHLSEEDTQLAPSEVHQCRATERRHRIVAAILRDPARLLRHPRPSEEERIRLAPRPSRATVLRPLKVNMQELRSLQPPHPSEELRTPPDLLEPLEVTDASNREDMPLGPLPLELPSPRAIKPVRRPL